jgi:hypothetical protein
MGRRRHGNWEPRWGFEHPWRFSAAWGVVMGAVTFAAFSVSAGTIGTGAPVFGLSFGVCTFVGTLLRMLGANSNRRLSARRQER